MEIEKWSAMSRVLDVAPVFGLKAASLNVLRAILSYHKGTISTNECIVFASNNALVRRLGMAERTLRRHIERLISVGLLQRKQSATGKRFARRSKNGDIFCAFGLDISPLARRHIELDALAQRHHDAVQYQAALRDQIKAELVNHNHSNALDVQKILRRNLDASELEAILEDLKAQPSSGSQITDTHQEIAPVILAVDGGQNDRHIETHEHLSKEQEPGYKYPVTQTELRPEVCDTIADDDIEKLMEIHSEFYPQDRNVPLERAIYRMATCMNVCKHSIATALQKSGIGKTTKVLSHMLTNKHLRHPNSYFNEALSLAGSLRV